MNRFHIYHARDCASNTNVMQAPGLITGVETYASLLKAARDRAELTQTQLAKKAGVAQGTVGNIESGERLNPSSETLAKLAKALGLLVDDLTPGSVKAKQNQPLAHGEIGSTPKAGGDVVRIVKREADTNFRRAPVVAWARLGEILLTTAREGLADAEHLPVFDGTPPESVWAIAEADHPRFGIKRGRKLLFAPVSDPKSCEEDAVHLFVTAAGNLILGQFRRLAGDDYEAIPDSGPPMDTDRHGIKVLAEMIAIHK
tara:strand:+ start:347 stop:1117 length:771 start_codon:yes stop_codon:yes gene_type:complete